MQGDLVGELRRITNKILLALNERQMTRPQLQQATGLSLEDIARGIFQLLQKDGYVRHNDRKSEYYLTAAGREAAPPKYIADPEKFFRKPANRHIVGVAGKFDYSQPLHGPWAMLYDALIKPMRPHDWYAAANLENTAGSVYAARLLKLKIIETVEEPGPNGKPVRKYRRRLDMKTKHDEPELTPADPDHPVVKRIIDSNPPKPKYIISNFPKANISLDDAIVELMERFPPMEIMLCCLAHYDAQWRRLARLDQVVTDAMARAAAK